MTKSVFEYQWNQGNAQGKVIYDLLEPETIFSGEYSTPPPEAGQEMCQEYKRQVHSFLELEWAC